MSTGFNNVSDSTPNSSQVQNPSNKTESRPDWLLYSVPALAFLIGIVLFTFICKTQRRRNSKYTGSASQRNTESAENNKKDETQSYENVEAAIYNNQDKVTYYVSADEDYLNPDAFVEEEMPGPDHNTLQLPSNLTDTDGESYENMEGCLYAQPRKQTQQLASEDEDYINPDEDRKQDLTLDQTDTESYEMMAGPDCVYNNTDFTATNDTEDDSYEQMNGIPVPF
ncbi:Ral GTPase-activating protein subunit beta [Labeo rohita]|uniref:Ral GTPase-activating protein subunit beta n=1 Tax=Labeo rohita TaxID=84645 RepID=A0ABQ8MVQ9_LABRO|nr:Ral GTPase-activating protein subunit beta [Labeo rohita]